MMPGPGFAVDVTNGQDLFYNKMRCIACHVTEVNGKMVGGVLGSNLSRAAEIYNSESFKKVIMDPPGDTMPKHFRENLTKKELEDLVGFLMTLQGKELPPPRGSSNINRGKWLFQRKGCFLCHGEDGKGGVQNYNYVNSTVPDLNTLADRMGLLDQQDANAILTYLGRDTDLNSLDPTPFPRFNIFLAKYKAIKDVIYKGSRAGKKDPDGPQPQLNMPSWKDKLSDKDVNDIFSYLLSLQPWEE